MHFQEKLDQFLMTPPFIPDLQGWKRFCIEFLFFGIKEARSCLFVGLFFLSIFIVPKSGIWIISRYDALLIIAITIQLWMVFTKLETWDELKAVMLFHIVGFALEVFKTSANIHSWSYPDFAYTKFLNVPLFSGFMYAAIGSYIIQAWRLLDVKIYHHPPYIFAVIISLLIYINFFTHHFLGDYRWYIAATVVGLYARTTVILPPMTGNGKCLCYWPLF
ncbi:DUF817 family (YoaT) [Commensalibacter communis]|nr:DUF817 family protein [Commensalibacter communis]CAI3947853.1 DUF817 family (YoaT) [Commensalibacter communis]CAI3949182.1 DUF817 family (YoaT) [Commensalibacter communis]